MGGPGGPSVPLSGEHCGHLADVVSTTRGPGARGRLQGERRVPVPLRRSPALCTQPWSCGRGARAPSGK